MLAILPLFFTIAVLAVLAWVVWNLIQEFPSFGLPTVKMLMVAAFIIVLLFVVAALLGIHPVGNLRLF